MIRVIVASDGELGREEVIFTKDMTTPAEQFFYMGGMKIDVDSVTYDMPIGFPTDTLLIKA